MKQISYFSTLRYVVGTHYQGASNVNQSKSFSGCLRELLLIPSQGNKVRSKAMHDNAKRERLRY